MHTAVNPHPLGALEPLVRERVPRSTVDLARHLLGKVLVRELPEGVLLARVVETEAYLEDDPACHAYRGITPRNRSLFLDVGHAYVYLCYGVSYMLNVASEHPGTGAGVLVRALEPLHGLDLMQRARPEVAARDLLRGPGRLTAALSIDRRLDGIDLFQRGELWIAGDRRHRAAIGESVRIGLRRAAEARLRFFVKGSEWLSGTRRLNA
ncbi:MAG TPA: DNA-3-methyladenine glycosylase [Steroidobacteraceae bacterium]|nr:DNA-3-methyladenine glycosylase [Steroidobacteraceae bacterium]